MTAKEMKFVSILSTEETGSFSHSGRGGENAKNREV